MTSRGSGERRERAQVARGQTEKSFRTQTQKRGAAKMFECSRRGVFQSRNAPKPRCGDRRVDADVEGPEKSWPPFWLGGPGRRLHVLPDDKLRTLICHFNKRSRAAYRRLYHLQTPFKLPRLLKGQLARAWAIANVLERRPKGECCCD